MIDNTSKVFQPVGKTTPLVVCKLTDIANDETVEWFKYHSFDVKQVPLSIFDGDMFMEELQKLYEFNAGILKLSPQQRV